ncbi:MAG: hypothetical protein J6R22_05420 [Alphaproteobacteria bacterium]|nr:hypothetical protein [Alphaproteobacteria bacterium]
MANPFSICTITLEGINLIAQATAANPIVFVDAMTSESAAADVVELAGEALSFYDGPTGSIDAVSAVGSNARIIARFPNALDDNDINIKSVCVTARLANQTSGIVPFAAMSDANSTIYIPGALKPAQNIRLPFYIIITDLGTIQTVAASAAAPGDLERFVSMHAAGDPASGENQTILGNKTFSGDIIPGGVVKAAGASNGWTFVGEKITPTGVNGELGSSEHPLLRVNTNGLECGTGYMRAQKGYTAFTRDAWEIVRGIVTSDGKVIAGTYQPVVGAAFMIVITADGWTGGTVEMMPGDTLSAITSGLLIQPALRYQAGWAASSATLFASMTMRLMHGITITDAISLMPVLVQRVE